MARQEGQMIDWSLEGHETFGYPEERVAQLFARTIQDCSGIVRADLDRALQQLFDKKTAAIEFWQERGIQNLTSEAQRLLEAQQRGLWRARSNSAFTRLTQLIDTKREQGLDKQSA